MNDSRPGICILNDWKSTSAFIEVTLLYRRYSAPVSYLNNDNTSPIATMNNTEV